MAFFDISFLSVTVLSATVFLIYKYFTYYFDFWKQRGLPYKTPSLVFGNLKDTVLFRKTGGKIYKDIYNEYPNDKYIGCFKFRLPELMITDPDIIKLVLVKDFNIFHERSQVATEKVEKLNANLFQVQGLKWRNMRKTLSPVFTSGKLKTMFPLIVEKAEDFQKLLENEVKNNYEQEVRELMARFTTDVIGSCAFGINMNSMTDTEAMFRKMGKNIFKVHPLIITKAIIREISPNLFDTLGLRVIDKATEDFFIDLVDKIAEERKATGIRRNDFIDMMLDLQTNKHIIGEGEETVVVDNVFMAAQAFIFFAAGFETSSAVMSFTLFELAKNKEVQQKLIEEIDEVRKRHNGKLSYEAISEMHYLECVISETMRKYPALGNLTRVSVAKYTFPDINLTIDKNTNICIPVLALHYDPKYYPEPEKFIPERFLPENKNNRHPMVYLPFGEGPRNCIGLRFGKMQSMIGLASLLGKFTVDECSKTEKKIVMNPITFVTACKNGVWLKLKPRL